MALDIVKLYISLLSEFFTLSDVAVMASASKTNAKQPAFLPTQSNSFITAFFLMKILGEIQDSTNELNGMEISNEATSGLKNLLESTKWRFEDILTNTWLRGEESFEHPFLFILKCDNQMRLYSTTWNPG